MALLRQCLKLQRERSGVPVQEIDFPPIDAETLCAMRLAGLEIGQSAVNRMVIIGSKVQRLKEVADAERKRHVR